MQILRLLLERLGIEPNAGASDAQVVQFETETGLKLPAELREFYRFTDGVTIDANDLKICSLDEAKKFWRIMQEAHYPRRWGYLWFTDSNDSNPFCVCCAEPLVGYVACVYHDDSAKLAFPSLESFFKSLDDLLPDDWQEEGGDIEALTFDFERPERTKQERETGRTLLAVGNGYGKTEPNSMEYVERGDAFRFAMTLLGKGDESRIVPLLDFPDDYISQSAEEKLKVLQTPEAQQALQEFQKRYRTYLDQLEEKFRAADFKVKRTENAREGTGLQVGNGYKNTYLNLRAWYALFRDSDAQDKAIKRLTAE